MTKRNKLRYQSKGNQFPTITLTGKLFLRHIDEEAMLAAVKGDMKIYLSTDAIAFSNQVGNYEAMGFEGYLKADVSDGKAWKPLSLEEFFPGREQYFSKYERPIDIYNLCEPILKSFAGRELIRTYREHYVMIEEKEEGEE